MLEQITERQTDQEVKKDFKNKIKICESEASETNYWLEIIEALNWARNTSLIQLNKKQMNFKYL